MDLSPPPPGVDDIQAPNSPPQPPPAMGDIPPFNNDFSSINPLPSPINASDPQRLDFPSSPPSETGSVSPSNITDSGHALGAASQMLSQFPTNPPPSPPQSFDSPGDTPVTPRSDVPAPGNTLTRPPLTSAGNGTFDLTGVLGEFISESTRAYWESVPGGEKWTAMVKSYLILQTFPPSKEVRTVRFKL